MTWKQEDSVLLLIADKFSKTDKIASFDIDDTIIKTKSGKPFAIDKNDWTFLHDCVSKKIHEFHDMGFKIVFITNQHGLKTQKDIDNWKDKIDAVLKQLAVSVSVFVAMGKDLYRKPMLGFWDRFIPEFDIKESFYCGDAAGRDNDFSDTDYKMAINLGITFYVPEQLFLKQKSKLKTPASAITVSEKIQVIPKVGTGQQMIINVGYPGSGKTSFTKKHLSGLVHINQDTLKTPAKCLKECESALKLKKSVVIDNTNPTKAGREKWIQLAEKYKVNVICYNFTTDLNTAKHNNHYRHYSTKAGVKIIPDIAYFTYRKKFEEPDKSQFEKIFNIDFSPSFDSEQDEKIYQRFYF